jgi:hypothetical protein
VKAAANRTSAVLRAAIPDWPPPGGSWKPKDPVDALIDQLEADGLLEPGSATDLYREWLQNALDAGVSRSEIKKIARNLGLRPQDFEVLRGLPRCQDPDGKTFFMLSGFMTPGEIRSATIMAYVFNARTDYDAADDPGNPQNRSNSANNFVERPYSTATIEAIAARALRNTWSYRTVAELVMAGGGAAVATPNGMLMAIAGNPIVGALSQKGGTTFGDVFMLPVDNPPDPSAMLRQIVANGSKPDDQGGTTNWIDLDRLLHHEEIHSRQWAVEGKLLFPIHYAEAEPLPGENVYEWGAGLRDGGYR